MKRNAPLCLLGLVIAGGSVGACAPLGTRPATAANAPMKECGPEGIIDDFEDNNNQINTVDERGGYWYTYADNKGSTVWPVEGDKGGTFTLVEGGHESKYAVEMKGKLAGASIVYAAMGLNFLDPKGPYDASKYLGITFFVKRAPGSIAKLRVKLPDGNTDPDGGICSACYNDYFAEINVSDQWQRVVIPFRDLKQEPDWGVPRKPHSDASKLFAIHWEAKIPGGDYDFYVDDIAFVCKG